MTAETIRKLIETQTANPGVLTLLTMHNPEARGFGRIVRDAEGQVQAIVEEIVALPEQLAIQELNVGAYCFDADWLWDALLRIPISPKGEYFLTDVIEIAIQDGHAVESVTLQDVDEAIGINNRVHLAEAEAAMRARINRRWMEAGVTLVDPGATYIDVGVTIGADTVIFPNTHLVGDTHIGEACQLGPNSFLRDCVVGDRCQVLFSFAEFARLESDVEMGPFARLRKGAHLAQGVHMGNFGEVKNAYLGPGTKMGHFSYIGDATIGQEVNIGAGTITCNYDGKEKHHTNIESKAFIGSDTMLVAPVSLGEGSATGAGSIVTKDIPSNTLAVGMPARAIRKLK
jgi:bifunctional UDP-N-acetylglucosamine pyrophosphorylase/glucosamine-1-phosphate N-acetyltransferase